MNIWSAPPEVENLLQEIKEIHHTHLQEASFAIAFVESKPFIKDRINLGRVSKFSQSARIWQSKKYDFLISLCSDVWHNILNAQQKAPLLDLCLSQCKVEFEPETVEINGKVEKVKDDWGRIQYTTNIKRNDEGVPVWKVTPRDIQVITENISKFGLWYEDLNNLKEAVIEKG